MYKMASIKEKRMRVWFPAKCVVCITSFIFFLGYASGNVLSMSSRLMITFLTEHDNNITHIDLNGIQVVKQYGRRLLLDLNQPFDLEAQRNFWILALKNVQMVEVDAMASVTQGMYTPPWNFRNSESFSVKVEDVMANPPDNGDVVVAVLDTGIAELAKSKFLRLQNGYDFVSSVYISKDSDGRDADATDPGDGGATCQSSWHGTAVSSIIASAHNSPTVRGIAPYCSLLYVRIAGECGMVYLSDVADAIVWSAGGRIDGVPDNPRRAHVINLSIGGLTSCPSYLQSAINQAVGLGALVIAAAGNDAVHVSEFSPANCANVVSVAASGRNGSLASYSNWGATVSAPGGSSRRGDLGIVVFYIDETWGWVTNAIMIGTSFASPHVAALASLMGNDAKDTIQMKFNRYLSRRSNQVMTCRGSECAGELVDWPKLSFFMNLMNCTGFGLQTCYATGQSNACTYGCMCGPGFMYSLVQSSQLVAEGCVQCPLGKFSASHEFKTECSVCESCQAGKYRVGCGNASAGVCVDCKSCPLGKYMKDCSGTSPGICTDCGLQCTNAQYISTECGGISPGVCSNCLSTPFCQYQLPNQCILPANPCMQCDTCQTGKYRTAVCGLNIYGACLSCPSCPGGQYRTGCGGFSSGTCKACPSCPPGYYSSGCEYLSSGQCNPCIHCNSGQWLSNCTGSNPGVCAYCTN